MATQKMERRARRLATLVLFVPALLHLFPLLYVLSLSLKSKVDVFKYPPSLIPSHWSDLQFANYVTALNSAPLARFLLNSLIAASAITVLQVFTGLLAACLLYTSPSTRDGLLSRMPSSA